MTPIAPRSEPLQSLIAAIGKPTVVLWGSAGVGLVLVRPTGVAYLQQAGGHQCIHPHAEGVYVPLEAAAPDLRERLEKHFREKWGGWGGCDAASADFIDGLLAAHDATRGIRVDRERLPESTEAWVHVDIPAACPRGLSGSLGPGRGVLTWPNSD